MHNFEEKQIRIKFRRENDCSLCIILLDMQSNLYSVILCCLVLKNVAARSLLLKKFSVIKSIVGYGVNRGFDNDGQRKSPFAISMNDP